MYYIYIIQIKRNEMKTIKANQNLTSRSIGDHDCIFKLSVIERKGNFAKINYDGQIRRIKVRIDFNGNEYLLPDSYSFAPAFRAIN